MADAVSVPGTAAFNCKECNVDFPVASLFEAHNAAHKNPCEVEGCRKTFALKANLKAHMRCVHNTTDRPFVCDFPGCGKSFAKDSTRRACYRAHFEEEGRKRVDGAQHVWNPVLQRLEVLSTVSTQQIQEMLDENSSYIVKITELQDEIRGVRGEAAAGTKKKIEGLRQMLNQNLVQLAQWADRSVPEAVVAGATVPPPVHKQPMIPPYRAPPPPAPAPVPVPAPVPPGVVPPAAAAAGVVPAAAAAGVVPAAGVAGVVPAAGVAAAAAGVVPSAPASAVAPPAAAASTDVPVPVTAAAAAAAPPAVAPAAPVPPVAVAAAAAAPAPVPAAASPAAAAANPVADAPAAAAPAAAATPIPSDEATAAAGAAE